MRVLSVVLLVTLSASCMLGSPIPKDDDELAWVNSGKFEGDIIFEDRVDGKNGLINPIRHWPNATVIYSIAPGFDAAQLAAIQAAFDDYEAQSCIRFKERTDETSYVRVQGSASGCYSSVGRTGLPQTLNLQYNVPGTGCFRHGTILHEFLHALGFYHQQSATNRDDYVTIVYENIEPGYENNFNTYPDTVITDFGVEYDYGSVMHYPEVAFSTNGEPTIIPLDPNAVIGQRVGFSAPDLEKLNCMYCQAEPCAAFNV